MVALKCLFSAACKITWFSLEKTIETVSCNGTRLNTLVFEAFKIRPTELRNILSRRLILR
uniref:Uncharacterized protein n=1 Tax=Romanomermis culicivorax TaxID=13658 RepID=A0A915HND1_ROMCU